jgi:exosortase A-associated hydrolase 1
MNGAMAYEERALAFACEGETLYGIACVPAQPSRRAVLIVVGGPQYRVGSHRQFALLARSLAQQGIASLRFDYRSMGDATGTPRNFEAVDQDLRAAVDQLFAAVPGTTEVVLWGLCDAASAALFYAGQDERVSGLVLLNPWVRTPGGHAKATLRHYYVQRLLSREFWTKVFSGRFNPATAGKSFTKMVGTAMGGAEDAPVDGATGVPLPAAPAPSGPPLPERMLAGATRFTGKLLLVTSGNDLTAQEFMDLVHGSRKWQKLLAATRVSQQVLAEADHTFSRRAWRDQVAAWTADWVRSW